MIRRLDESSGNVLGWEVTGKVTEEEVRTLSEEFKAAIAEHGNVVGTEKVLRGGCCEGSIGWTRRQVCCQSNAH